MILDTEEDVNDLFASRIVEVMNRALAADPVAVAALVNHRVECNSSLADDPTIQCGNYHFPNKRCTVGLLGILNGLCGVLPSGWGRVMVEIEKDGTVNKFLLTRESDYYGKNQPI